jgi:integrase
MKKNNYDLRNDINERVKYKYRIYVKRLGRDWKTVIAILKHIRDFEIFINFADFGIYDDMLANKYVEQMFKKTLSLSYISENVRSVKEFLLWLQHVKGYKSKLKYEHIQYLRISDNQRRTAKAPEYKKSYTYDQIIKTIRLMPEKTVINLRSKAMISLQALCSLRISELRTVKMKNLIQEDGKWFIYVNPRDMEVKGAKTRNADFMQLPPDILENVLRWKGNLEKLGFKNKDSFFPQIPDKFNQSNLLESKVLHIGIKSNTTIRRVFEDAFTKAGFEYLRPHSFRHTMVRFAEKISPEFLNAVRQALGHKSINTTFQSYGELSELEQRERISKTKINHKLKPSS